MGCAQWVGLLGLSLGVLGRAQWPLGGRSEKYALSILHPGDGGSSRGLST